MKVRVYKKIHKIKISSLINKKLSTIKYGVHGLKVVTPGILTAKQVETVRRVISRATKRISKVFIRVFFNLPITKKPLLSRMGKGCGVIKSWIAIVKKGTVVIEVDGISQSFAKQVLKSASIRLPLQVSIISRYF